MIAESFGSVKEISDAVDELTNCDRGHLERMKMVMERVNSARGVMSLN